MKKLYLQDTTSIKYYVEQVIEEVMKIRMGNVQFYNRKMSILIMWSNMFLELIGQWQRRYES